MNTVEPTIGVVVLTMGTRPAELQRALNSLSCQIGVDLDVVIVGNGWDPVGIPATYKRLFLPDNIGIPAGRNAGAAHVVGEFICFLDDDSWFLDDKFLLDATTKLYSDRKMGLLQPRITDPERKDDPRRWIPRLRKRSADMPSKVFHVGETCLVMPRVVFDRTGGWAGGFWYAHEGIELAWRVWNTGHYVWYAGDMDVGHPVVDPRRHSEFYRLNARNRVWLARRNLPGVVRELYAWNWLLVDMMRLRNNKAARAQYIAGWRSGWNGTPWHSEARERLSWKTLLRMTIAGRLPII